MPEWAQISSLVATLALQAWVIGLLIKLSRESATGQAAGKALAEAFAEWKTSINERLQGLRDSLHEKLAEVRAEISGQVGSDVCREKHSGIASEIRTLRHRVDQVEAVVLRMPRSITDSQETPSPLAERRGA